MNLKNRMYRGKVQDYAYGQNESGFTSGDSLEKELYNALLTYNPNCEAYFEKSKVKTKNGELLISYRGSRGNSVIFGIGDILSNNPQIGKSVSPTDWAINESDKYFSRTANRSFFGDSVGYSCGVSDSRISDDMDEQNSVDREVELLQDLYSDYTDDLEEMRSNYANGREDTATVEDWEQAYRALIDEIRGLDIENPQEVYDTLVDWNWHRLTWCMCLAGKLGQGELNEAVKWLGKYAYDDKSYLALKNIANSDFGGSRVGDSRRVKDARRIKDDESLNTNSIYMAFFDTLKSLIEDDWSLEDNVLKIEKNKPPFSTFLFHSSPKFYVQSVNTTGSKKVDDEINDYFNSRCKKLIMWGNLDVNDANVRERVKNKTLDWMDGYTAVVFSVIMGVNNNNLHIQIEVSTDCDKYAEKSNYSLDDIIFDENVSTEEMAIDTANEVYEILKAHIVPRFDDMDYDAVTLNLSDEDIEEQKEYEDIKKSTNNYINNIMLEDDPDLQREDWFE